MSCRATGSERHSSEPLECPGARTLGPGPLGLPSETKDHGSDLELATATLARSSPSVRGLGTAARRRAGPNAGCPARQALPTSAQVDDIGMLPAGQDAAEAFYRVIDAALPRHPHLGSRPTAGSTRSCVEDGVEVAFRLLVVPLREVRPGRDLSLAPAEPPGNPGRFNRLLRERGNRGYRSAWERLLGVSVARVRPERSSGLGGYITEAWSGAAGGSMVARWVMRVAPLRCNTTRCWGGGNGPGIGRVCRYAGWSPATTDTGSGWPCPRFTGGCPLPCSRW
jgi:hypothetical protein